MGKEPKNEFVSTPVYYGWVIVVLSAMVMFFSGPGQTYSVSIFIDYYIETFGWSRSLVSSLYSGATLVSGLTLTFVGKKADFFGHRKMVSGTAVFFALVCIWMSIIVNPFMLVIGFFFLRLSGQGTMSLLSQTLPPQWFEEKRAFAMSLVEVGGVGGAALIPPLNNFLIQNYGATSAWRFWSVLLITVMLPAGWFFIRNKPEDIGEEIDGKSYDENGDKITKKTFKPKVPVSEVDWSLDEAWSTKAYWLMIYCAGMTAMIGTGITFHLVSIITEKGHTAGVAAALLGFKPVLQFPFSFVAGKVFDNFPVHIVKGVNYILMIIAIFLLLTVENITLLFVYAGIYGIFMGFEYISNAVVWPNYFGRGHLGSIRGSAMTAMVIGSALGPLPFGLAFDITGNYNLILGVSILFPVAAMAASFLAPRPEYEDYHGS